MGSQKRTVLCHWGWIVTATPWGQMNTSFP
jgi:hypothetical protein